jgi:hypothetical protein
MKKLILLSLLSASIVVLYNSYTYAQNEVSFVSQSIDGKAFRLPVNELKSKAVRHFNHEFSFADNETWFKIRDGFTVKFMANDIQYRVGYDKNGNWLNTVKLYHEAEMPQSIRRQIKSDYYDYAITLIEELAIKNQLVYIVHIDNEKGFKKLYLADGEMKIMEEYSK